MFSRRLLVLAGFTSLAAVSLTLTGCSAKPENSPVIRKKFAEVDEIKTNQDETNKLLRTLVGDITVLKDQVSNLRALSPDASGEIEVISRLEEIEQRLNSMEKGNTIVASATVPTSMKQDKTPTLAEALQAAKEEPKTTTFNNLAVPETKKTEAPKTTKTETKSAPKTVASTTTTKSSAPAAPKTVSSAPRGFYYTLQPGDTLEKLATDNGISVSELAKANRLPSGARPLKGQRLFIPANKK